MPTTSSINGARLTGLRTELELAGFDLGEVEHLIDQAEQMCAGAVHALQRLRGFLRAEPRRIGRPASRSAR